MVSIMVTLNCFLEVKKQYSYHTNVPSIRIRSSRKIISWQNNTLDVMKMPIGYVVWCWVWKTERNGYDEFYDEWVEGRWTVTGNWGNVLSQIGTWRMLVAILDNPPINCTAVTLLFKNNNVHLHTSCVHVPVAPINWWHHAHTIAHTGNMYAMMCQTYQQTCLYMHACVYVPMIMALRTPLLFSGYAPLIGNPPNLTREI
jgi:hypothetical protein